MKNSEWKEDKWSLHVSRHKKKKEKPKSSPMQTIFLSIDQDEKGLQQQRHKSTGLRWQRVFTFHKKQKTHTHQTKIIVTFTRTSTHIKILLDHSLPQQNQ